MLVRLPELPNREAALAALEDIFFLSTLRKDFATAAERDAFFRTWTGWYVERAPDDVWFALAEDGAVIGYLTGCKDSAGAVDLARIIPKYEVFADRFAAFPAHLHVNVRPGFRDHGIGRALVDRFAEDCRANGLPGLHLVTGVFARNVSFYQRAGFTAATQRGALLFLGRPLD
ncbi:L-amino acid N-acyltransferase YncA [Azospirillum baldaniorum]|uniref:GNAT family N-acetyltransferase n=1 Tax=Azospirillum baldaniorum TaxID=1064539 RepID=UPI0011A0A6E8|nr:GNAT family N-acetyltransferase [Azospirillum baldaniorum]TWA70900.1 L-amino acid N-acyltransferase YncA [Azospirillum baldaniorum]